MKVETLISVLINRNCVCGHVPRRPLICKYRMKDKYSYLCVCPICKPAPRDCLHVLCPQCRHKVSSCTCIQHLFTAFKRDNGDDEWNCQRIECDSYSTCLVYDQQQHEIHCYCEKHRSAGDMLCVSCGQELMKGQTDCIDCMDTEEIED